MFRCIYNQSLLTDTSLTCLCRPVYTQTARAQTTLSAMGRQCGLYTFTLFASSAWWGFATASDKHRIEAFARRGVRRQLYGAADPTRTQLAEDADETLFSRFRRNIHHVLYRFLLNPTAVNIICALDGITFHYQPKQMIGTLYLDSCFRIVTDVLSQ